MSQAVAIFISCGREAPPFVEQAPEANALTNLHLGDRNAGRDAWEQRQNRVLRRSSRFRGRNCGVRVGSLRRIYRGGGFLSRVAHQARTPRVEIRVQVRTRGRRRGNGERELTGIGRCRRGRIVVQVRWTGIRIHIDIPLPSTRRRRRHGERRFRRVRRYGRFLPRGLRHLPMPRVQIQIRVRTRGRR